MLKIHGPDALQSANANRRGKWNRTASSSDRSDHPEDASNRIYDGHAEVAADYAGPRLSRDARIFAMGSCFAREMESALRRMGGAIVSTDSSVKRPEFQDRVGRVRTGFFNRFTPRSILQEFQWCFGELDGWDERQTLLFGDDQDVADFNYWRLPDVDESRAATLVRRQVARDLVRRAAEAEVIVLTLGFTEAWLHRPSGFYANSAGARHLKRNQGDFELHMLDVADTLDCLEGVHELLSRRNRAGFQLVVTVSPVPLQGTFSGKDVVVANMDSKATLRAAAAAFVHRHANAHYFPSYEMVLYSRPDQAWRPDRIHVQRPTVKHIVQSFVDAYYEQNAFAAAVEDAVAKDSEFVE